MTKPTLSGVIAAIATAVDGEGEPDIARSVKLARYLLDNGCDGLNVLGTTGEATSFSLAQRSAVMTAYRDAGLPLDTIHVGLKGTAGQAFGAWLAKGVTFELEGEGNDYEPIRQTGA